MNKFESELRSRPELNRLFDAPLTRKTALTEEKEEKSKESLISYLGLGMQWFQTVSERERERATYSRLLILSWWGP